MRTRLTLVAGTAMLGLAGSVLGAAPANAQDVTFTLAAGGLSIAQPTAAAALTASGALSGLTGTTVAGSLGTTKVTDDRAGIVGWTSKITGTTAFTNGAGKTSIPVTAAKAYVPGVVTVTGTVVATAGTYLDAATGLALTNAPQTLVTATAVVGNNTATFAPSLSVAVPGDATAGDYTGAVTQTVS